MLNYINVKILSDEECKQIDRGYDPDQHICVVGKGGSHQSACIGDSGSALVINHKNRKKAIGILSYKLMHGGDVCFNDIYPMMFTRIQSFISWLTEVIDRIVPENSSKRQLNYGFGQECIK